MKCHVSDAACCAESLTDFSSEDEYYSRIENNVLKLKSNQNVAPCQRATYYFDKDLSTIKGFEACIHINELRLPKNTDVHFYFSLGNYELHATIEKKQTTNTLLQLKVDDKGVSSNLKGAVNGRVGNEIEQNNFSENFIQISLCPKPEEESEGELYGEAENIEITTF